MDSPTVDECIWHSCQSVY